jgi:hypothetical protein
MLGNTGRLQHIVGSVDERLTDDATDLRLRAAAHAAVKGQPPGRRLPDDCRELPRSCWVQGATGATYVGRINGFRHHTMSGRRTSGRSAARMSPPRRLPRICPAQRGGLANMPFGMVKGTLAAQPPLPPQGWGTAPASEPTRMVGRSGPGGVV